MPIDKDLYRKALEFYRQWNETELIERIHNAGKLTPEKGWQRYVALVEFCWQLCPQQSERQRTQKLREIDRYYARVKRLEAWRKANGKTS
ncbi:MAG: hypothetical protein ACE5JB_01140 [bacterium]